MNLQVSALLCEGAEPQDKGSNAAINKKQNFPLQLQALWLLGEKKKKKQCFFFMLNNTAFASRAE